MLDRLVLSEWKPLGEGDAYSTEVYISDKGCMFLRRQEPLPLNPTQDVVFSLSGEQMEKLLSHLLGKPIAFPGTTQHAEWLDESAKQWAMV